MASVCRNRKGFTLIEVMVAMFILLFGMLALLNTAAVVVDNNLINVLRDESTGLAELYMDRLRNTPFNSLSPGTSSPVSVPRTLKGVTINYQVITSVIQQDPANPNTLTLQVTVEWIYKGKTYQHGASSVVNNSI